MICKLYFEQYHVIPLPSPLEVQLRNSRIPLRNVNILLIEIQGNEREDHKCRVTI